MTELTQKYPYIVNKETTAVLNLFSTIYNRWYSNWK